MRPEGTEKNLERGIQYGGEKGGNRIEERSGRTLTKARDLDFTGTPGQGAGIEYKSLKLMGMKEREDVLNGQGRCSIASLRRTGRWKGDAA